MSYRDAQLEDAAHLPGHSASPSPAERAGDKRGDVEPVFDDATDAPYDTLDEPPGIMPDEPDPPSWRVRDGATLALPWWIWKRWRRRPWFPRVAALVRKASPAGTLRHKRTGRRYPLYRGQLGGRRMLVVTRPRGRLRREILAIQSDPGGKPGRVVGWNAEALLLPGPGRAAGASRTGRVLTRHMKLRLPHSALHSILSRLQPEQLRALAGGSFQGDPARAVVRGIARIARRARHLRRWRARGGGQRLEVYEAPGYRLLVHLTAPSEGEILLVTPTSG